MSILIILFSNSFIRKLRFDKLDKIFHDLEVVPLFGDMQIAPFNYVKTSKHYDSAKWPMSAAAAGCYIFHFTNFFFVFHDWFDFTSFFVALPISAPSSTPQANIMVHLTKFRENHLEYSSELARYSNEVTTTYKETPRTDHENKALTDLALRGLHLLSDWTSVVTELYR